MIKEAHSDDARKRERRDETGDTSQMPTDEELSAESLQSRREQQRRREDDEKKRIQAEFGLWLRDQRKAAHLSQVQASEAAILSVNTWSAIERGEAGTRYATIPRIAKAVGVESEEAYRRAGFTPPTEKKGGSASANEPASASQESSSSRMRTTLTYMVPGEQDMSRMLCAALQMLANADDRIALLEARVLRLEERECA